MGKKDRKENEYFGNANRFADLFNGYFGEAFVDPRQLEEADSVLTKSDKEADIRRMADCLKKQNHKDGSLLALYLLENQMYVDYGMVARVMLEEGIAYDGQMKEIKRRNYEQWKVRQEQVSREKESENQKLESPEALKERENLAVVQSRTSGEYLYRFRKDDRLKPVLPLVVYWGEEKWDGAKSMHELLDFGEARAQTEEDVRRIRLLKTYVPDYRIHVLDVNTWEDFSVFQTEIRQVFELYVRRNDKNAFEEYVRSGQCDDIDPETVQLVGVLTGNKKFQKIMEIQNGEEKKPMWKAIEDIYEDGIEKGIEKGHETALQNLMQTMHFTVEQAMDALLIPEEKREMYRERWK